MVVRVGKMNDMAVPYAATRTRVDHGAIAPVPTSSANTPATTITANWATKSTIRRS